MTDQTPNQPADKLDTGFYASLFAAVAGSGAFGYLTSTAEQSADIIREAAEKGAEAFAPALIALLAYKLSRGDSTITFKNFGKKSGDSQDGPDAGQP